MSIIREFTTYIRRPYYFEHKEKWSKETIISLLKLFALKFVIIFLAFIFARILLSFFIGADQMPSNQSLKKIRNIDLSRILMVAIFGPFFEELLFRSWLRKRWSILSIPLLLILIYAFIIVQGLDILTDKTMFYIIMITFIIYAFVIYNVLSRKKLAHALIEKSFPIIFWITALLFGLVHLSNFNSLNGIGPVAVLLVLPQIISGIFYGFICMRFSFSASFLMHSVWNGSIVLLAISTTHLV